MIAPHFKDEIASLQKRPFLAGFDLFWSISCLLGLIIMGKRSTFCKKNCPQMSFPGCREAPNILLPLLKGPHRLLNWQIQVTRVSWVGQSTRGGPTRFSCVSLHELEFKKIKEVQNGNAAEKCDENMAWKTVFHNRQSHFLVQTSSGAEEGGCCPFVRFPK